MRKQNPEIYDLQEINRILENCDTAKKFPLNAEEFAAKRLMK